MTALVFHFLHRKDELSADDSVNNLVPIGCSLGLQRVCDYEKFKAPAAEAQLIFQGLTARLNRLRKNSINVSFRGAERRGISLFLGIQRREIPRFARNDTGK
jgi:hypothetical protein